MAVKLVQHLLGDGGGGLVKLDQLESPERMVFLPGDALLRHESWRLSERNSPKTRRFARFSIAGAPAPP